LPLSRRLRHTSRCPSSHAASLLLVASPSTRVMLPSSRVASLPCPSSRVVPYVSRQHQVQHRSQLVRHFSFFSFLLLISLHMHVPLSRPCDTLPSSHVVSRLFCHTSRDRVVPCVSPQCVAPRVPLNIALMGRAFPTLFWETGTRLRSGAHWSFFLSFLLSADRSLFKAPFLLQVHGGPPLAHSFALCVSIFSC
jgi:hypothetical protein